MILSLIFIISEECRETFSVLRVKFFFFREIFLFLRMRFLKKRVDHEFFREIFLRKTVMFN